MDNQPGWKIIPGLTGSTKAKPVRFAKNLRKHKCPTCGKTKRLSRHCSRCIQPTPEESQAAYDQQLGDFR